MSDQISLINLVESFREALNQHDVDKVMTMFTEDVEFEIVGVSKYSGRSLCRGFQKTIRMNAQGCSHRMGDLYTTEKTVGMWFHC